jgi:hypothetical protein
LSRLCIVLLLRLLLLWPRWRGVLLFLLAFMSPTRKAGQRAGCADAASVAKGQCAHHAHAHLVLRGDKALRGILLLLLLLVPLPFLWLLLLLLLLLLFLLLLLLLLLLVLRYRSSASNTSSCSSSLRQQAWYLLLLQVLLPRLAHLLELLLLLPDQPQRCLIGFAVRSGYDAWDGQGVPRSPSPSRSSCLATC